MADANSIVIDVAALAGGRREKVSEAAWRRYVVHMADYAKSLKLQELRKGKGVDNKPLARVKPKSRPDGATGPPLSPHRPESRSQKWLRATPGHKGGTITLWWSHGWGKILGYHARGEVRGAPVRDVIGLTSADMRKLKEQAARYWALQDRLNPEKPPTPATTPRPRPKPKSTPKAEPEAKPVPKPPVPPPAPPKPAAKAPVLPGAPGPYGTRHPRVVYLPKGAKPKASSSKIQVYETPAKKPPGARTPPLPPKPKPELKINLPAARPPGPTVKTTIPQPPKPVAKLPPAEVIPPRPAAPAQAPKPPVVKTTIPQPKPKAAPTPSVKAPVPKPEPRLPAAEPIPPRATKPPAQTAAQKLAADRAKLLKLRAENAAAAAKLKAAQDAKAAAAKQLAATLPPGVDPQLVQRAVAFADQHGVELVVDGRAHLTAAYGPDKVKGVHAAFDSGQNKVFLNLGSDYWKDPAAVVQRWTQQSFTSSSHLDHAIHHEVGHALHFRADNDEYRALRKQTFNATQQARIRAEVSSYAATNPVEFVAEVFAGLKSGKTYSSVIMKYYDKIKGPKPS